MTVEPGVHHPQRRLRPGAGRSRRGRRRRAGSLGAGPGPGRRRASLARRRPGRIACRRPTDRDREAAGADHRPRAPRGRAAAARGNRTGARAKADRSDPRARARFRRASAGDERPDADHVASAGRVLSTGCSRRAPEYLVHCVSAAQQRRFPPLPNMLDPIPNGVPVEHLQARHARRDFALALGRICPEKGFHLALDAARLAGTPLLIAGQVFPYEAHRRYFSEEIGPRLGPTPGFSARSASRASAAFDGGARSAGPEPGGRDKFAGRDGGACLRLPGCRVSRRRAARDRRTRRYRFSRVHDGGNGRGDPALRRHRPRAVPDVARRRFSLDAMIESYFRLYRRLRIGGFPALSQRLASMIASSAGSLDPVQQAARRCRRHAECAMSAIPAAPSAGASSASRRPCRPPALRARPAARVCPRYCRAPSGARSPRSVCRRAGPRSSTTTSTA